MSARPPESSPATPAAPRRRTLHDLARVRETGQKIAVLTCYDAGFARALDAADVDAILIGDSLGMVVQGRDSTLGVSVSDMAYHTRCVVAGSQRALIIADMPFGSYQASEQDAFRHAAQLMESGAQMVKLEGGEVMAPTIEFLVRRDVPVCAHIGLTPQSVHALGGYRVQGRDSAGRERIVRDARAVAAAGAVWVVLEAMPQSVADAVCEATSMVTIGIGASPRCDGQVLVLHDMLGLSGGRRPRFVHDFLGGLSTSSPGGIGVQQAAAAYVAAVRAGTFPGPAHVYE